jgi:acyl-CoA thioesterase FadM
MFITKRVVEFGMCDAAGILFYPKAFELAHSAYEELILSQNSSVNFFKHNLFAIPIINTTAMFYKPITLHETITLEISLTNKGVSSFELKTEFKSNKKVKAVVTTKHVFVNKKDFSSVEIPKDFLALLEKQLK